MKPHDIPEDENQAMAYELWDTETGNVIGSYASSTERIQAAFRLGQVNPTMDSHSIAADDE